MIEEHFLNRVDPAEGDCIPVVRDRVGHLDKCGSSKYTPCKTTTALRKASEGHIAVPMK